MTRDELHKAVMEALVDHYGWSREGIVDDIMDLVDDFKDGRIIEEADDG